MARKRRKRKSHKHATSDELFQSSRDSRTDRLRNRKGLISRKWVAGIALFAVFLFFLPAIVVRTPLKQLIINRMLADFEGTVTVDSISCGWIANTELRNVVAVDKQGDELFRIGSIHLRKSLTSMMGASDLGTVEVIRPEINLRLRPDGSNLEDAIAGMLNQETNSESSPAVRLSVADGRIAVTDEVTGQIRELQDLTAIIELYQPESAPLRMEIEGLVQASGSDQPGTLAGKVVIDPGKSAVEFRDGMVELNVATLPLAMVSPLINRFVEPSQMAGTLDGIGTAIWSDFGAASEIRLESASTTGLQMQLPRRIGRDQIRLDNAWIRGGVKITPTALETDRLVCQTDVGSFKANGTLDWQQIANVTEASIPENDFQAEGTVQLAPLTAMLPNTIPLQEGIGIESGTVQFNANSRVEGQDRRVVLNVESAGLTAIHQGQRLNWHKPARLVAAVRQTSGNVTYLESLDLNTSFLQVNGEATTVGGKFTVKGDLQAALAEANQFLELDHIQMQGNVDGAFQWVFDGSPAEPWSNRPLRAGGRFLIEGPQLTIAGETVLAEPTLDLTVQASGKRVTSDTRSIPVIQLDTGLVELHSGSQFLKADLIEPVVDPSLTSPWNLQCELGGELGTLLASLSRSVPNDIRASGMLDADATITLSPQRIDVKRSRYEIANFQWQGSGVTMNEPQVSGEAIVTIDRQSGGVYVNDATIATSAFSARGHNLRVDVANGNANVNGQLAFLANVNRCMALLDQPANQDSIHWFGQAQGTIQVQTASDSIGGSIEMQMTDLVAARVQPVQPGVQNVSASSGNWARLLEEKQVDLKSSIAISRDLNQITFQQTELNASAATVVATGVVSELNGLVNAEIQGSWSPDWSRLKPLMESLVGDLVSLDGVQGGAFRVHGPVFHPSADQPGQPWLNPELKVQTVANWDRGALLGLPMGNGKVQMQVDQGVVFLDAAPIPFSGGTLQLNPRLDLRGAEPSLYLPAGPTLQNVELTPEICRGWMQYIAPFFADVTSATGRISVATGEFYIPLQRIEATQGSGTATLHSASIRPGPLGRQLSSVVNQVKMLASGQPLQLPGNQQAQPWLTISEQQIPFSIQNGRVYHDNLQFEIDGVAIKTSGSVGMDQSLQLVAHVPVLEKWVGNNRFAKGLIGKTLQIPVAGSLLRPQVDNRGLLNMSQQLLQQAAGSAINQEVQGLIQQGNQAIENELKNGLKGIFGFDK